MKEKGGDMLEEQVGIISNKMFQRLAEKTQVLYPKNGREETVQNRLTHSFRVATMAQITAKEIGLYDINIPKRYKDSTLENICLLHDIGHPPFGHEGARTLNSFFKEKGLIEGFDDNNNNFVVLEKNQIEVSDYTKASLIKYPKKLYEYQKAELYRILNKSIDEDVEAFKGVVDIKKRPKRTILCEVMDEADRNSYICADLADYFSLSMGDDSIVKNIIKDGDFKSNKILSFLYSLRGAVESKNKTLIKKLFSDLEILFAKNYYIGDNLALISKDKELLKFRELLYKKELDLFIYDKALLQKRTENLELLNVYIRRMYENVFEKEESLPSKTYEKMICATDSKIEKLRLLRDMIAETTDWFVMQKSKKFLAESKDA